MIELDHWNGCICTKGWGARGGVGSVRGGVGSARGGVGWGGVGSVRGGQREVRGGGQSKTPPLHVDRTKIGRLDLTSHRASIMCVD